jgi:membrane protease YdiL (CAAX protease family)
MMSVAVIRKNVQAGTTDMPRFVTAKAVEATHKLYQVQWPVAEVRNIYRRALSFMKSSWIVFVIFVSILAPQLALIWQPVLGAYVNALSVAALLTIALWKAKFRNVSLASVTLPLASMVSMTVPTGSQELYRVSVQYGVMLLLAGVYTYMFREKQTKKQKLALRKLPHQLPLMIIIGEVLGVAGFAILRHHYAYRSMTFPFVVGAVILFAITEELLFRGLLQRHAARIFHPLVAACVAIIAYSAMTIGTGSILPTFFGVASSGTLCALYYWKPSLVLTIVTNVVMKLSYIGLVAAFILK